MPKNVSREKIYGKDEDAISLEEEAADLMEREMLKRFQARREETISRRNQYYGSNDHQDHHSGERKTGSGDGNNDSGGVEPDWTEKSDFQVEEIACMAALDVSPRVYPLLRRTAEQIKRRTKSMLFEYKKGSKGIDADQFEEIVEKLMSRADAYEE